MAEIVHLRQQSDGPQPEPPPSDPPGANAPDVGNGGGGSGGSGTGDGGGGGGEPPPKKEPKKEKTIDFGKLNELLEDFALIYGTDTVWDGRNRIIMKLSAMAHAHGADYVRMWKSAPASWRREERCRWTVLPQNVVFDPTEQSDSDAYVNLYGGLVMEPADHADHNDVALMLRLVRHLTSRAAENADECDQVMNWLMCWLAYPLQHPGAKLRNSVVMHGDEGAGKNFLFDTQVMLYGEYGATVGQDELEDKFNDWRSRKLFVVGDEVSSRQELVHNKNRLKALITSTTVQINPKNLPRREEANHINIAFLSNELQPLALDNTDRRYLVIFTPPALEAGFYRELAEWRRNGGLEKWMRYLLDYPLDGYDPYAPAPITAAKTDLIELNRKTPERFWVEWSGHELDLPYWSCSVDQAYRAYTKYCQRVGDRFPVQKPIFSRMVTRMSESMGKPCRVKAMALKPEGIKQTQRMLLVAEPQTEGSLGDWAQQCVDAFEQALRKYVHGPHSPDEGEPGGSNG